MKLISKILFLALLTFSVVNCRRDDLGSDEVTLANRPEVEVSGEIKTNTIWDANKKYLLKGFVFVREGATLTIQAGTLIKGDKASKGALIIERGAKIIAEGTASRPIIFTSSQAKGQRSYGDWGGIIVLGKAPNNLPNGEGVIEGGVPSKHGGNDPNDNSGILKYVRIEYGGIPFLPNQEINGLTLGSVGKGTQISHIQVSYCGDDSFEMFGGTVDAKYLVAYKGWDDDFDTDNGYSGKIQYGLVIRDPQVADQSGSNGLESDNDASGTDNAPFTSPVFSNVTVVGAGAFGGTYNAQYQRALHLRRNTRTSTYNSVFIGYPVGVLVDGSKAEANATSNVLQFRNNYIVNCTKPYSTGSGSTFDIKTWFEAPAKNNKIVSALSELKISGVTQATPRLLPETGSSLLSGANFEGLDSFFEKVNFVGAFGTTDWTAGWTNFDPQNTEY